MAFRHLAGDQPAPQVLHPIKKKKPPSMIQMNTSPGLIALRGNLQVYGMILFVWD